MAKTVIDLDEDALALAMAHYGTTVKREAVNRALREVSQRREHETSDLEEWVANVGERLASTDWVTAWRA
ncbi:MAG: type II toxin-antitoxin system VapB family antitoxin [Pseudonocardiales bacterium]